MMLCILLSAALASLLLPSTTGDTPTLPQMDAYVQTKSAEDLKIATAMLSPHGAGGTKEIYVAPGGGKEGVGTKRDPVDLGTAFTSPTLVGPGTIVWCGRRCSLLQPKISPHRAASPLARGTQLNPPFCLFSSPDSWFMVFTVFSINDQQA